MQRKAERVERRDSSTVERVEWRDTLREVTTITVQTNDKADTLKVTQITDRSTVSDRDRFKAQDSRVMVKADTVYVERSDSVLEKRARASPIVSALKWVFWIIVAVIGLITVIKISKVFRFFI